MARRTSIFLVATILVATGLATASAKKAPKPMPCRFLEENALSSPACDSNPLYTMSLTKVAEKGSFQAKFDVKNARYQSACLAHHTKLNISTPEGKAACRADFANRCYVSNNGRSCVSSYAYKLKVEELMCPGLLFTKIWTCFSKHRKECGTNNDGCEWNEDAYFGGRASYLRNIALVEANVGGPLDQGACGSKEEFALTVGPNGTYNATAKGIWNAMTAPNANNQTDWELKAGTCPAANLIRRVNQYFSACDMANTVVSPTGIRHLNTTDYTASRNCIEKGCQMIWNDGTKRIARGGNITETYYTCGANYPYLFTFQYNFKTDKALVDQFMTCGLGKDYTKDACNSAVVVY